MEKYRGEAERRVLGGGAGCSGKDDERRGRRVTGGPVVPPPVKFTGAIKPTNGHANGVKARRGQLNLFDFDYAAEEPEAQATGVAKAKTVAAFARMMVEAGEAVVLWGWHREVYDIWNAELADLNPAMYTGSESPSQKEAAKTRFVNRETDLLIMSLRSGAGVDGLQFRSATGIFGELDWSPGIHQQCIWRLDREGQQAPVSAFFLVTDDGSDPPMLDVLGIKASEAQHIIDPHLGVEIKENDTSNLRKLVERYLDRKKDLAA